MSTANDDEFGAFFSRDLGLVKVTPDAVAKALEGFALPLQQGRDEKWLATAVQRALGISRPARGDGPDRTSNADIRIELERLAGLASATWRELFECSEAVDYRVFTIAWRHWDGSGATDIGEGITLGEPSNYRRFKAAVAELDWLAGFLRQVAVETASKRGPWRQSEKRWMRIERGQFLAPIFEAAFGQPVSANNYPNDVHKAPTAFMDFYQRMVTLAFGARETVNLSEVTKEACRLHRKDPVQFAAGLIPGLGGA